jgi:hypothetical protein
MSWGPQIRSSSLLAGRTHLSGTTEILVDGDPRVPMSHNCIDRLPTHPRDPPEPSRLPPTPDASGPFASTATGPPRRAATPPTPTQHPIESADSHHCQHIQLCRPPPPVRWRPRCLASSSRRQPPPWGRPVATGPPSMADDE